jgi:two-component system response regulator HydG
MMKAPPKILLVDDDAMVRVMYADYLTHDGNEVELAASANEAMARLAAGDKFDLLITDIMMAKMDGWELLEYIRSELKLSELQLPVIIISAFESDTLNAQALGKGANGSYVKGGMPLDELARMVRIHTGRMRSKFSDDTNSSN